MSEEEKQAIENLIKEYEIQANEYKVELLPITFDKETYLTLKTTLNYIDKLQKDNYELDRENQHYFDRIQDLQKEIKSKNKQIKLMQEMNLPKEIEINYISKDIIKKLIEDKKQIGTYNIEYLKIEDIKELLGE